MNLKAIIQKIASWFKSEVKTIETRIVIDTKAAEQGMKELAAAIRAEVDARISSNSALAATTEASMSTPSVDTQVTTAGNNVNTAVQLALALKAIDASLSVEAVQAATNAALAAAYPAAAAA